MKKNRIILVYSAHAANGNGEIMVEIITAGGPIKFNRYAGVSS